MRTFRSKSNFVFGVIFFSIILLCEIPMLAGLTDQNDIPVATLLLLILPFVASFIMLVVGLQTISISDKAVTLELFFIPIKELEWEKINEAGIGAVKINKNRYLKQLYVSNRRVKEKELENLDSLRFERKIIWFDYSLKAEKHLAFHLGMTDSID